MATVVSATTRALGGAGSKQAAFIRRASILLRDAVREYGQGNYVDAMELGYQAALRTAGAYIAGTSVAKRRRLPAGAWSRVALAGGDGAAWASSFAPFSKNRSRLISGLDNEVDPALVADLIELTQHFLDEVESGGVQGKAAA